MKITCIEVDSQGRAHQVELGDLKQRLREENGVCWIDVESSGREEARGLLVELGLNEVCGGDGGPAMARVVRPSQYHDARKYCSVPGTCNQEYRRWLSGNF